MTDETPATAAIDAFALSRCIQSLLKDHSPEMRGAVLADLVAIYFAGHHPAARDQIITLWIQAMRDLIKPSEQQLFERLGGPPPGWSTQ